MYKLCREILAELRGQDYEFSVGPPGEGEADLAIWDYSPGLEIPQSVADAPSKHLFLVHRNDINHFRQSVRSPEATILLKPVTRAAVAAFLSHSMSAHAKRNSDASALRADRDELLQCLIETNLKLQEYDQDRTNFLARGVHDFRAPLTAVNGYCGLLLSEALGSLSEQQKEVLRRIQHSAKRLSRMSSAMFQLSIGRHVKRRPDFRKTDLQACLDQVKHEIGPMVEAKSLSISVELEPEPRSLYFEQAQIEQLLINLLDNGCKFTPKNGCIEVRGYPFFWERRAFSSLAGEREERRRSDNRESNGYRVDIRNSGALIPEPLLPKIFEEYTSYSGGQDRSGGGLGLAICRMIALQHGGTIWAENTAKGPMFSLVLPFSFQRPSQVPESDERELTKFAEVM